MRKIITVIVAVAVLFSAVAFADDLSDLTDEELLGLHREVLDEMERRNLPDAPETDSELADITERVISFFAAWNRNDPDEMLKICDSGWKATVEDPRAALPGILAGMTPLDATIERVQEIAGEGPDGLPYCLVTVNSHLDRNDGKNADMYKIKFLVRKEENGLWYVNPTGLDSRETAEEESSAEKEPESDTEAAAADTVLYYQPDGGEYYHLDRNCLCVNPKYLPLQGSFLYSELNDEPYCALKRCEICGAPFRAENRSDSMSFRDAVDAAGEYAAVGGDIDYLSVAAEKDGLYYRTVTILDDLAKELYMAAGAADSSDAAFEAFNAYAWSLPVCYTEEITAKPKSREELEAQAGKTVGELLEEGYSFYGVGGGENLPTVVDLSYGMFIYEFEVDASFDYYLEHEGWDGLEDLKVKSGNLSASLSLAADLDWLADGTYQPQVVPNITAEEAAAADSVLPLEEYSRKAWPLIDESYSDLQQNPDVRYGQVYMVEGVVRQVLSQSPARAVLFAGEDGNSLPVIVECPEGRSFSLEKDKSFRIYADAAFPCYSLPVLTARYIFFSPSAGLEDEATAPEEESVKDTVDGNMKTYQEMADGTWMCDGYAYQYRLEIKGRMPNAAADSCFVYLSNLEEISFEQACMAAGLSSDLNDYFSPEEAVLVEMN